MDDEIEVVRSVCPFDCPDTCALLVQKQHGRVIHVTGNPHHPVTRGAICNKVRHLPERTHHPDRLLYPLKRVGEKGSFAFERISWDEAYTTIIDRFNSIIATEGAEAILPYSFYGNMGVLNAESMDRRFFHRLGASALERTICNSAGAQGYRYTTGINVGIDPEDTVHAKLIVIWGCNIVSTNMHQVLYANEARKRGATIVHIDVHRNKTSNWADWFVPITPGTDAALALGIMHVLHEEKLVDEQFVAAYTTGHAQLVSQLKDYPPQRVSQITGVPVEDILRLARLYGETSPSFIRIGNGLQHHDNGGMAVRTIACLPALTGQWKFKGGGALKGNSGFAAFDQRTLQRPDLQPNPHVRSVNMNGLGDALLSSTPPIKALFVYSSNPAQVAPDQNRVRQGLLRSDLFTVVHELFLTDTCLYADLVLPATSHFENLDLYKSYWHLYLQLHQPILPPQGECKSNFTLFRELARHMGFEDDCFNLSEEAMIRELLHHSPSPYMRDISYEQLRDEGWAKLDIAALPPFPEHIPTPSGKFEFYSQAMLEDGFSPLPEYTALPDEPGFPLLFISSPNHHFLNSTFANLASMKKLEGAPQVALSPHDATLRSIKNGDRVRLWNDRGQCILTAVITTDVRPGVVVSQGLWWEDKELGYQSVNALTSQRLSDMGRGATFFSTHIDVEKLQADY
jgi:anaerobic selenocysteine-containing dehydrogenase